jgi:hypothetical protein
MKTRIPFALGGLALALSGCATLGLNSTVQAPQFRHVDERPAELRLLAPSFDRPTGGIAVRLYARVHNPNPYGVVLTSLAGTLRLDQQRAAEISFPLGLPMRAVADTIIPLEIAIGFSDVPGLRDPLLRAVEGAPVGYRLDGTVRLDAGLLGQPSFGPMMLMQGTVATRR